MIKHEKLLGILRDPGGGTIKNRNNFIYETDY